MYSGLEESAHLPGGYFDLFLGNFLRELKENSPSPTLGE
jgi:hypothetical protein